MVHLPILPGSLSLASLQSLGGLGVSCPPYVVSHSLGLCLEKQGPGNLTRKIKSSAETSDICIIDSYPWRC